MNEQGIEPIKMTVWQCPICNEAYTVRQYAEQHIERHVCKDCGKQLETTRYDGRCEECSEKHWRSVNESRWATAKNRIAIGEWKGELCYSDAYDIFASDPADIIDEIEADGGGTPSINDLRLFECFGLPIALDFDSAYENLQEKAYEDWELDSKAQRDLQFAIDQWNQRYGDEKCFHPDYHTAIYEPERGN